MEDNEERKRLYDETASLIADTGMRGQISVQEMRFLLSLLDQVMVTRGCPEMIELLKDWRDLPPDEEVDQIIKETLVNIDFKDRASVQVNLDIIKDLLGIQGGNDGA